ncbi:MAG: sugar phosphate isomerase/epimerase [Pseudomonadota bacterium]
MNLSFQLYSSRNVSSQTAFLSDLAAAGYTQVEGFGGVYEDATGFRAALDAAGLSMPSGHFGLDMLEGDFDACMRLASTLGIDLVVAPYLAEDERPTDVDGYKVLARRLSTILSQVHDAGFGFAWHNHDFELTPLPDGSIPLEILFNDVPNMGWEADLAWVARGGADPRDWVNRYGNRIAAVHIKDIAPEGQNRDQDGWSNVGEGIMDWSTLLPLVLDKTHHPFLVVEHDNPADVTHFARAARNTIASIVGDAL